MGNNSSTGKKTKKGALVSNEENKLAFNEEKKETDDVWILECIVEYVQSAECTIFVDGFIDENCLVFDANNTKMNDEYTQIHSQYKEMIESLLITRLTKLGLTAEQFTNAMQKANKAKFHADIMQYITAIHDISVFKNIMIQRNIMLEQEVLKYLSKQNASNMTEEEQLAWALKKSNLKDPADGNKMTEEEQLEWALTESIAAQQLSLPEPSDPAPSAPSMSAVDIHIPMQSESDNINIEGNVDHNPFDIISNINMSEPKRVSLKPLKLQRNENSAFEGNKNNEDLPILTAASIKNIKFKQSAKTNPLILKQKQMILNMRKQKRNREMETIQPGAPGWNVNSNTLNTSNQSALPPLHKSLFGKMSDECNDDAQHTLQ